MGSCVISALILVVGFGSEKGLRKKYIYIYICMIGNNSFLVPVSPFFCILYSMFSTSYPPPALLFVMRRKYKNKLFSNFVVALCVPYEIDARKSHSISGDFIFIYCSCCFRIIWGSEAWHACPYMGGLGDSGKPVAWLTGCLCASFNLLPILFEIQIPSLSLDVKKTAEGCSCSFQLARRNLFPRTL